MLHLFTKKKKLLILLNYYSHLMFFIEQELVNLSFNSIVSKF